MAFVTMLGLYFQMCVCVFVCLISNDDPIFASSRAGIQMPIFVEKKMKSLQEINVNTINTKKKSQPNRKVPSEGKHSL